jgi:restriction system protein
VRGQPFSPPSRVEAAGRFRVHLGAAPWHNTVVLSQADVPKWKSMFWPTLQAVSTLGGSGTIGEIEKLVARMVGASEEQQAVIHGKGPQTELNYRLAWCRTYLKGAGYLENSSQAVWSLTEAGRRATETDMASVESKYKATHKAGKAADETSAIPSMLGDTDGEAEGSWREELLSQLLALPPERFEHLAKRLLREAGFTQVEVTGGSGDEGIDGTGIYRPTLVSFPVFFQCKRYKGTVGPSKVRDFRGAMAGRGAQGILITTGTFTADARSEASRSGAPLIDLIDAEALCDLLKKYQLGVLTTERLVESVQVLPDFFSQV